jgi:hypothetical protein
MVGWSKPRGLSPADHLEPEGYFLSGRRLKRCEHGPKEDLKDSARGTDFLRPAWRKKHVADACLRLKVAFAQKADKRLGHWAGRRQGRCRTEKQFQFVSDILEKKREEGRGIAK